MAISTVYRYGGKVIALPSGQVFTFPGSSVFKMLQGVPSEVDIYDIDTIQKYPLGSKIEIDDNVFRYVEYGGTTKAGDLIQAEAPDTAHDDLDPTGTGSGAGITAGSKLISIADTITLVVDEYAGGTLTIEEDTGLGYSYIIEANDAPAAQALVQIKMGLAVAIDSTSDVKLVKSRWKEVIIAPTSLTAGLVGVGVAVGADGSFGWVCTNGPWAVFTDGTLVVGQHARASDGTAGSVEPLDRDGTDENEPAIGTVVEVGPDNMLSIVNINI